MEDAVTLAAVLRRASPETRRRVLVVLFALHNYQRGENAALSLASIVTVLEQVMLGKPVRFLFASGGNATVIRSHDRGSTWRVVYRMRGAAAGPAEEDSLPDTLASMEDIAKVLLLPDSSTRKGEDTGHGANELETQISCITTLDDMVAVCGSNGFLAVSADRGMNFFHLKKEQIYPFIKDKTHSASTCWRIGGVVFLSDIMLAFFCRNQLFSVEITSRGFTNLTFGRITVIRDFSSSIGCIKTFPQIGNRVRELFVSSKGELHYSFDGGESFVTFPHQLGTLRALEPLDMTLRRCEIPRPPDGFVRRILFLEEGGGSPTGKKEGFVYRAIARDLHLNGNDESTPTMEGTSHTSASTLALPHHLGSVRYRVLFVGGVGAPILPYDYTALLFLAASFDESTGRRVAIGSMADNVDYMPYVKSGPGEHISVSVSRGQSAKGFVFARSNASGVSLSCDMGGLWTVPTQAYMVELVAVDGGEFVCFNRRNVVSTVTCDSRKVHTVPTALRVPYLTGAAVML